MTSRATVLRDGVQTVHRDSGSGPTIPFPQGFSLTQLIWEPLREELTANHRCVTSDPRDVTLVGHSLGGAAAVTAVAAVPRTDWT